MSPGEQERLVDASLFGVEKERFISYQPLIVVRPFLFLFYSPAPSCLPFFISNRWRLRVTEPTALLFLLPRLLPSYFLLLPYFAPISSCFPPSPSPISFLLASYTPISPHPPPAASPISSPAIPSAFPSPSSIS